MNDSFKTHMILIIKGLTLKDLNTVDEPVIINENKFSYNSIPSEFTSVEEWPKYTNLLCWYCNNSFKDVPWFTTLPIVTHCDILFFNNIFLLICHES